MPPDPGAAELYAQIRTAIGGRRGRCRRVNRAAKPSWLFPHAIPSAGLSRRIRSVTRAIVSRAVP
jgi:hypothetical protein